LGEVRFNRGSTPREGRAGGRACAESGASSSMELCEGRSGGPACR